MSIFWEKITESFSVIQEFGMPVFFMLAVLGGLVYPVVFLCVFARKRIKTRREKRAIIERKLKYTLPDKDNTFVRTRLNTVLKETEEGEGRKEEARVEKCFCLEYARKMLNAVKNARLGVAERLEITELSALFELYLKKSDWGVSEVKTVNEVFSRVLKLAAKYSVAVA